MILSRNAIWRLLSASAIGITISGQALAQTVSSTSSSAPASPTESPSAAPQTDTQADVGDIIVTAQKRSESINRVGLTIQAFGAQDLERQHIENVTDLAKVVPGLTVAQGTQGTPVYTFAVLDSMKIRSLLIPPSVYMSTKSHSHFR